MKNIHRKALCATIISLLLTLVIACPNPQTGKIDPYLTTENALAFTKVSLTAADAMFTNILVYLKKPAEEIKKIRDGYNKVRTAVDKALVVAGESLAIAKKANKGVTLMQIMADTDKAWKALREFITALMPSTTSTMSVTPHGSAGKPNPESLPHSIIPSS